MKRPSLTFEQWVEERWLPPVPEEPVEILRRRVEEGLRLAHPGVCVHVRWRFPARPNRYLPATLRQEEPEYFDRLLTAHADYGNIVVKLPDGAAAVFDAGMPQHWIERRLSARVLEFPDYESWRSYNCHYWSTTAAGQEEARRRTEAMWATNPEPYWSMLHPPFYYGGYFGADDRKAMKHAEYHQRFREERRALGDIVILHTLYGPQRHDEEREVYGVVGGIFAIGTPQRIIDLEAGPRPDSHEEGAIFPADFLRWHP